MKGNPRGGDAPVAISRSTGQGHHGPLMKEEGETQSRSNCHSLRCQMALKTRELKIRYPS